jgi:hypothetical protein
MFHNLYDLGDRIKDNETDAGCTCSTHGKAENAYKFVVGKPKGKGQLGRPMRLWDCNIN